MILIFRTLKSQAPGLKSIIDLTATTKYYQPIECEALGIKHKKILVPGTVVPPKQSVEQFFSAVEEFKDEEWDEKRIKEGTNNVIRGPREIYMSSW